MIRIIASFIFLLLGQAQAQQVVHSPEVEKLFDEAGVTGTFALYEVSTEKLLVHNFARAEKRFIPASTFKIANSLIGLSTGAISSVDQVLPYGGKPQPYEFWEQDMALREAIKVSNVPVYQELARRIGLKHMREGLAAIPYGNAETGDEVDTFWLKGPLKISAIEQTRYLARLAQDDLPFPVEIQRIVRDIARFDEGDGWVLYAKTGWTIAPDPDIGWWVGWVVKGEQVFSFALNIDMTVRISAAKRVELGKASLMALGVL